MGGGVSASQHLRGGDGGNASKSLSVYHPREKKMSDGKHLITRAETHSIRQI